MGRRQKLKDEKELAVHSTEEYTREEASQQEGQRLMQLGSRQAQLAQGY